MIIVTGTAMGNPETLDELVELSLAHVHRSRSEPGCISHNVHHDVEEPLRLVFVEQWEDIEALRTHFEVPASGGFVEQLAALTTEPPTMRIFDATKIKV
jgi:quinol monooxygenase YgiN